MITKILSNVIVIILFSVPLFSEQVRIAIYDFNARGVPKSTANRVSDWIRTSMVSGQFTILERSQMAKIFKEHRFAMTGCTDSDCAVKIGKMLSANKVLVGTVEKFGRKYIISGRLVDVEKGTAEFGHQEKVSSWNDLDKCANLFAENILRKMRGEPTDSVETKKRVETKKIEDKPSDKVIPERLKVASFITEGWVSQHMFRVTGTGVPKPGLTKKNIRRMTATEAAIRMCKKRIIDKFCEIRGKSFDGRYNYSLRNAVAKEFVRIIRNGTIVKSTYDRDDNCEIVYQIESKNLKRRVERVPTR